MGNAIVDPSQVTPEWLSGVLQTEGILSRGQVRRVIPGEGQSTFASSVWYLDVDYSTDVSAGAPGRLFLKPSNTAMVPGEFDSVHLLQEIFFYNVVAPTMDGSFTFLFIFARLPKISRRVPTLKLMTWMVTYVRSSESH
jgi:hypothetical protein